MIKIKLCSKCFYCHSANLFECPYCGNKRRKPNVEWIKNFESKIKLRHFQIKKINQEIMSNYTINISELPS